MDLSKTLSPKNVMAAVLMALFLFANIFAVRQLMRLGAELFFYDKLNVAYQTGGNSGFRAELNRIIMDQKMPREAALGRAFQKTLSTLEKPRNYIQAKVDDLSKKVVLYRLLRNVAFLLILGILGLRWALYHKTTSK